MVQKLKSFLANDAVFTAILLLLVGVASFGLGRMSVLDIAPQNGKASVVQALPSLEQSKVALDNGQVPVVVSKSGTKYHLFDCPGAKQMKPENRIEFPNINAAQAAGYTPAGNCKGLQ